MTGQMRRYRESLKQTPAPVMPSQVKGKLDLRGLMDYAKSKGVKVAQLAEEEKLAFMK